MVSLASPHPHQLHPPPVQATQLYPAPAAVRGRSTAEEEAVQEGLSPDQIAICDMYQEKLTAAEEILEQGYEETQAGRAN